MGMKNNITITMLKAKVKVKKDAPELKELKSKVKKGVIVIQMSKKQQEPNNYGMWIVEYRGKSERRESERR
jgi:predicted nucleotidyltransferase